MSETKTYDGGCHCGKVRFKAKTDLAKVIECNCSICSKKGHLLTFVMPDAFELVAGEAASSEYQFNKHVIHHTFCPTCGVGSYAWGTGPGGQKMFSINVRCLEGVDPSKLSITSVDGRSS